MLRYTIYLIFGAGLIACSSVNIISVNSNTILIANDSQKSNPVDSIILPYRLELEEEMFKVISRSKHSFTKSRPNGSLNNWAADAILNSVEIGLLSGITPYFCLLNVGGLRSSLNEGEITLEDIYKLMPFDNEIVIVELPFPSLDKIAKYLISSGGEPISNAVLDFTQIHLNRTSLIDSAENSAVNFNSFYVITSDYLMNGGDNMYFFQDKIDVIYTNILIRDAMILEAKKQGTLIFNDKKRIILE